MKIQHAFTYRYDINHFGCSIEHSGIKEASCFDNVIEFCKAYQSKGRNVGVALVVGLRGWEESCTMGYHYLVKDLDTEEFADPQYSRYTFIELHSWTLEDYERECSEFEQVYGEKHCSEFYQWYCSNGYRKVMENGVKLIKSLSDCGVKLSDESIRDYFREDFENVKPKYGTQQIYKINVH